MLAARNESTVVGRMVKMRRAGESELKRVLCGMRKFQRRYLANTVKMDEME
jgi:hypothetical protein